MVCTAVIVPLDIIYKVSGSSALLTHKKKIGKVFDHTTTVLEMYVKFAFTSATFAPITFTSASSSLSSVICQNTLLNLFSHQLFYFHKITLNSSYTTLSVSEYIHNIATTNLTNDLTVYGNASGVGTLFQMLILLEIRHYLLIKISVPVIGGKSSFSI